MFALVFPRLLLFTRVHEVLAGSKNYFVFVAIEPFLYSFMSFRLFEGTSVPSCISNQTLCTPKMARNASRFFTQKTESHFMSNRFNENVFKST